MNTDPAQPNVVTDELAGVVQDLQARPVVGFIKANQDIVVSGGYLRLELKRKRVDNLLPGLPVGRTVETTLGFGIALSQNVIFSINELNKYGEIYF
jgi:hypothetical protein